MVLFAWHTVMDLSSDCLNRLSQPVRDQSWWPFFDLSCTFTVPLAMLPHSAPLPLMLRVPFPVASSDPQFDPHECAVSAGAPNATCGTASTTSAHIAAIANRPMVSLSAWTPDPSRTCL
jgi:hypothetical protein